MEKKDMFEEQFSHCKHYLTNQNGGNVRKWVSNRLSKFHDDQTVNKSWIIVLLRQVWVYVEKEKVLGQREKKMNLRGKENVETYSKYNTELIWLYL